MVNYRIPASLTEALELMKNGNWLPYAGGTDINCACISGRDLLFIGKLDELRQIRKDGEYIRIGAAVTFSEAERSPLVPEIMKAAIRKLAGPAIRNVGTFGGNLANGSGKADSALVDLVLDAKLRICSADGERLADATRFYHARKDVDLKSGELITEILIPDRAWYINYYYDKVSVRTSIAISNISVASVWNVQGGVLRDFALAVGSATDIPIRCTDIEQEIRGKTLQEIAQIKDRLLTGYIKTLELPLDRTGIRYRKQVCYRLLNYLINEEFTPIATD